MLSLHFPRTSSAMQAAAQAPHARFVGVRPGGGASSSSSGTVVALRQPLPGRGARRPTPFEGTIRRVSPQHHRTLAWNNKNINQHTGQLENNDEDVEDERPDACVTTPSSGIVSVGLGAGVVARCSPSSRRLRGPTTTRTPRCLPPGAESGGVGDRQEDENKKEQLEREEEKKKEGEDGEENETGEEQRLERRRAELR